MGQTKTRTTAGASAHIGLTTYDSVMVGAGWDPISASDAAGNSYTLYSKQINTITSTSANLTSRSADVWWKYRQAPNSSLWKWHYNIPPSPGG